MGRPLISREQGCSALAVGLWSAGFLYVGPGDLPWWAMAVLACAWCTSALLVHRVPLTAAAVAGGTQAGAVILALPLENPAPMAPALLVVYFCGRFIPDFSGLLSLPLLLAAAALPIAGASTADVLFGAALYGSGYAFGRLVRRRFTASMRAAAEAARLGARDPVYLAQNEVAAERVRVAQEATAVVGSSIEAMRSAAVKASRTLEPEDISAICGHGGEAVARLKAFLVELRNTGAGEINGGPAPAAELAPADSVRFPPARKRWRSSVRWFAPTGIIGVFLAAEFIFPTTGSDPATLVTGLVAAMAPILRRHSVAAMCWTMTVALSLCAMLGSPIPEGVALGISCVVITWSAVAHGRRWPLISLAIMCTALLTILAIRSPENLPVNLGLLVFTALAAHAWRVHGRAELASQTEMEELQLRFTRHFDAALAAGRLELARMLHDVASHAVGAMVMQANAASVLSANNPAAARRALDLVSRLGAEAGADMADLTAHTFGPRNGHAEEGLQATIVRAEQAGNPVTVMHADPLEKTHTEVAYRIIREALSNAVRHSPGSPISISIQTRHDDVRISVVNGPPVQAPQPPGTGFGLQGLRELVRGLGGTLHTGPCAGPSMGAGATPGFQLLAILPLILPTTSTPAMEAR